MALVQYAVQPSFHSIVLPDSSPVEDAVRLVCSTRRRADATSSAFTSGIAGKISGSTGAADVGALRRLTDAEWREMTDVPAMLRLHLKYLLRQSSRGAAAALASPSQAASTAGDSGASGFSFTPQGSTPGGSGTSGSPFSSPFSFASAAPSSSSASPPSHFGFTSASSAPDPVLGELALELGLPAAPEPQLYADSLSALLSMGFHRREALEALLVTDNRGPDVAVHFLCADQPTRLRRREEARQRIAGAASASPSSRPSAAPLLSPTGVDRLLLYREFLRGSLLEERLTRRQYELLKAERDRRKVSKAEHVQALREIGVSEATWERLRKGRGKASAEAAGGGQQAGSGDGLDLDCVVCLDEKKDHVCLPCGHVCLCAACVLRLGSRPKQKKSKCPMCEKDVDDILKVYW